jgi:hypothetical protein
MRSGATLALDAMMFTVSPGQVTGSGLAGADGAWFSGGGGRARLL